MNKSSMNCAMEYSFRYYWFAVDHMMDSVEPRIQLI